MTATDLVQLFSFAISLATVPVWLLIGATNAKLRYLRWAVIIPAALTSLYYALFLFTDWETLYPQAIGLLSALLRLYTGSIFLVGGVVMYFRYREQDLHE